MQNDLQVLSQAVQGTAVPHTALQEVACCLLLAACCAYQSKSGGAVICAKLYHSVSESVTKIHQASAGAADGAMPGLVSSKASTEFHC